MSPELSGVVLGFTLAVVAIVLGFSLGRRRMG